TPPASFEYDPTRQDRAWLNRQIDAMVRQLKDDVYEQAARLEQDAVKYGWRPIGPHRRAPEKLDRLARRIFRRRLLWHTWRRIADDELRDFPQSDGNVLSEDSARQTTKAAALGLDIRLT